MSFSTTKKVDEIVSSDALFLLCDKAEGNPRLVQSFMHKILEELAKRRQENPITKKDISEFSLPQSWK